MTPRAMGKNVREDGIAHALIIDRTVIPRNLQSAGWTPQMLERELRRRSLEKDDIFLFSVNDSGTITLILKDTKEDSGR